MASPNTSRGSIREARIEETDGIMKGTEDVTPGPMQILARMGFAGWFLWLGVQTALVLKDLPPPEAPIFVWFTAFGGIPMIALGCALTWAILKQPRRRLWIGLIILCTILLWKFYVGEIVLGMHPKLGGYTLSESLHVWFSRNTSGVYHFVLWLPSLLLVTASFFFYPIYCIIHEHEV